MPSRRKKKSEPEKPADKCALDMANSALHLDLNTFEIEVLLKACKDYRARIPSYLLSKQSELDAIDGIIQKLI
jgi:hypothetical protein